MVSSFEHHFLLNETQVLETSRTRNKVQKGSSRSLEKVTPTIITSGDSNDFLRLKDTKRGNASRLLIAGVKWSPDALRRKMTMPLLFLLSSYPVDHSL